MFRGKTTIVVGAGTGKGINMPLGRELAPKISEALRYTDDSFRAVYFQDEAIENAVKSYVITEELGGAVNFARACRQIQNGMHEASSIDEFIHMRRADRRIELMGKVAIVRCILIAESGSHLHFTKRHEDDTINFSSIRDTWLPQFQRFVTTGYQPDEIAEQFEKITLIVFNYDRCIEHYLLYSLRSTYGIDKKEAARILDSLEIIHPYGVVGNLGWQTDIHPVDFGETEILGQVVKLAEGIRTFTEQSEDTALQERIYSAMQEAELVLFLGFAFHDQNVELLKTESPVGIRRVYGTAWGFSDDDMNVIKGNLAHTICQGDTSKITLRTDLECKDFFTEYSKTLSKA